MSQAIAQSATQKTTSTVEWDYPMFQAVVKAVAEQKMKKEGTTLERNILQVNKLVSGVCATYRAHHTGIYGKGDKLPVAIFEQINKAALEYITGKLNTVNAANVISHRRGFYYNSKGDEITERVVLTGENKLSLKEQHLGCNLFIGQCERRLKDANNLTLDQEKAIQQRIMRLTITKGYIEAEQSKQAEVTAS